MSGNWFAGIGQAASGLNAARYGLSVVSQNIANADTPGYTRQISEQASIDGSSSTGIFSGSSGMGGVKIAATARTADAVLDARMRTEHANGGLADTAASTMSSLEAVFNEPSTSGLSTQLGDLWKAWSSVGNDPGSAGTRTVLLQKALSVTSTLNTMSNSLSEVAASTTQDLNDDLANATSAAAQLATLNGHIAVTTAVGGNVNDLLDQRDQLLDTLSKTVGGVATINANGTADVSVGGQSLVSGVTANAVSVNSSMQVSVGSSAVSLSSGTAAGRITALTTTIPNYSAQLDAVANSLSATVNAAQAAGYDLSGGTGVAMFSGSGAAGITVAITDPTKIAASSTPGGNLGGGNAVAAGNLGMSATGPDASYVALVGNVASASALAQQSQTTQATVVSGVDGLHQSISGVNYDEEVSSMLTYQHAFSASSRVMTTIDSMLDTLINHTGLVGRG